MSKNLNLVYEVQDELTVHHLSALDIFDQACKNIAPRIVEEDRKYQTSLSITHDLNNVELTFRYECEPLVRRKIVSSKKIVLNKNKVSKAQSRLRKCIINLAEDIYEDVDKACREEVIALRDEKTRRLYKRYTDQVQGSPYQPGESVIAMGHPGVVVALDYQGCGQTYPEDPMVIVRHDTPNSEDDLQDAYWPEEIE